MQDRGLSMADAMKVAGIKSRNTMKRLITEGAIQAERLPSASGKGHWRISESSLLALFEGTLRQQALDHLRRLRV